MYLQVRMKDWKRKKINVKHTINKKCIGEIEKKSDKLIDNYRENC